MKVQQQYTITEIRAKLEQMISQRNPDRKWLETLAQDPRAGVRKLAHVFENKFSQIQREDERMQAMIEFDQEYRISYGQNVVGVDEAGRGCLAGPVVAAAVILPPDFRNASLNDSKQMTPAVREQVYEQIIERAVAIGVGIISSVDIDRLNILQATYEAMRLAIGKLGVEPDVLINDAVTIPEIEFPQVPVIHGDALSYSIAAASVVAKVSRDRMMKDLSKQYPEYGFDRHVGYGTADHIEALRKHGPCPIHRLTFAKVL
jgi:ribonuclease HII